jgi:hypothetical protein
LDLVVDGRMERSSVLLTTSISITFTVIFNEHRLNYVHTFALIAGFRGKADIASRGRAHFLPAMARQRSGTGVVLALPTRESQPSERVKTRLT